MKYYFAGLMLLLMVACNKGNDNDAGGGVTDNNIPANANMYSYIHVFYEYTSPGGGPGYLDVNNDEAYPYFGGFSTDHSLTSSLYKSWIGGINAFPGPSTCPDKLFTVVSNSHTYLDLRNIHHSGTGLLQLSALQFALPGGGKITYGNNSFLNSYEDVWFTYINPAAKKYVMSTPDVTVDLDQKRWFLKSFGEFYLTLDHFKAGGAPVYLEYPIPTTLLSEAPDSIQTWLFSVTSDTWVPKGYAVKTGNSYKFQIKEDGIWNFAKKVKGLYKHIQFKTDQGAPVANAIIRIRGNTRELASERTNPEGKALCFLPTGEAMTAEILFDWYASTPIAFTFPVAAFENNSDIILTVPYTSPYVATISGNMKTCSGTTITQGQVRLVESGFPLLYGHIVFSAVGGAYKTALINNYNVIGITAHPLNSQGNLIGKDTSILINTGQNNVVNFTTCL